MVDKNHFGYEEIEHTADFELHVWAPSLPRLLEQAARGMYELSQTELADSPRLTREFEISFSDTESLLVDFLSELLFFGEDVSLAFDEFDLSFVGCSLKARLNGAPIDRQSKEIKAVTFHGMKISETDRGMDVNIVFDV